MSSVTSTVTATPTTLSASAEAGDLRMATRTTSRFSPGRIASVASTSNEPNMPTCPPTRRPLTQTSATFDTASKRIVKRRPARSSGSVIRCRYQAIWVLA